MTDGKSDWERAYEAGERSAARVLARSVVGNALVFMDSAPGGTDSDRDGWQARLRLLRAAARLLDMRGVDAASRAEVRDEIREMRNALQALCAEAAE